ncbi:type II toxin-antitoxin system YoeB family toxin [Streptomyces sp. NPDC001273]
MLSCRAAASADEHRLVYRATEKEVVIIKARYHY